MSFPLGSGGWGRNKLSSGGPQIFLTFLFPTSSGKSPCVSGNSSLNFATAPHRICSVKTLNEKPGFPTRIPQQKNEGVEKGRVQSERHARFKREGKKS